MWEERKNCSFILYFVDTYKVNICLLLNEPPFLKKKDLMRVGSYKIGMMSDVDEFKSSNQEKIHG